MATAQQQMGAENYEKLRNFIVKKESGGNYASLQNVDLRDKAGNVVARNVDAGYRGAYQIGAEYAQAQGLIKPGIETNYSKLGKTRVEQAANHKALMENEANWTIDGGVNKFLSTKSIQDQAFDKGTQKNYQALVKEGLISPNDPPDKVAGILATTHSTGVAGYKEYLKDPTKADGAGTRASTYYNGAVAAVNGKAPPPSENKTAQNGKPAKELTADDIKAQSGRNRTLKETRIGNTVYIGSTTKKKPPVPLPFANVLSEFSSSNAIITLSCLSKTEHNDPKNSYKNGNIGQIVLRSSGAGDLAGESLIKTSENSTGKYDFGINNLEIGSQITYSREYQASNANEITFEVYEPYSMGLFMQVCNVAARDQKWDSYFAPATFLLTIEFIGYDSNGKSIKIPNTTRHIPFTFKDIKMTASAGGSVYRIAAQPSNELVFLNNFKLFDTDIRVEGKTVQEALQSGEFSLQTIINKKLQEYAEKAEVPTAFDEVVIIFPRRSNAEQLNGVNQRGENIGEEIRGEDGSLSTTRRSSETGELYDASGLSSQAPGVSLEVAKINPDSKTSLQPKISRKSSAANLIQANEDLNLIGRSVLEFDPSMSGESKVNKQDDIQVDPKNPISRKRVTYDGSVRQFIYSQGTSIVNAISSILLHSKYCKSALEAQKVDPKGMIPWFRIESEVHFQTPKEGNKGDNNDPKLLVFKVVPYYVHSERNSANAAAPAGLEELQTEVAKVYDYLYTGKNTEILNFNIEFQQALFNANAKDQGKSNKEVTDEGRGAATPESNSAKLHNNSSSYWKNTNIGNMTSGGQVTKLSDNGGLGTTAADNRLLTALAFQRALNDAETDLVNIDFTIIGDPYYLADSGLGNFSNTGSGSFNVTESLAMDYQSGEVDVAVNFRTPIDYNSKTGIMDFGDTSIVKHFSGLYRVLEVKHRFQNGKFTQDLKAQRRRNQTAESTNKPVPTSGQGPTEVPVGSSLSAGEEVVAGNTSVDTSAPGRLDNGGGGVAFAQGRPRTRVAAFNRSDLANAPGGTELSATANPVDPGVSGYGGVELLKTKVMTTLNTPTKSGSTENTSEFSSGNA